MLYLAYQMLHKLVIFISSTADLTNHRDAVATALRALNIDGSRFESWPTVPAPVGGMSECLRRVEESDAVVLLLAEKIPEAIRKRVLERPDVFRKMANLDDKRLDDVVEFLEHGAG